MKTLAKIFITLSVVLAAISVAGPGSEFLWGFLKPLSALLFVAFFITNLLAKQYACYDEEHSRRIALAMEVRAGSAPAESRPPTARPVLTGRYATSGALSAKGV